MQTSKITIGGAEIIPPREHEGFEINAVFGTENSASVSISDLSFCDGDGGKANTGLNDYQANYPLEGAPVEYTIKDTDENGNIITQIFNFYTDWNTQRHLSPVEQTIALLEEKGVLSFDERAKAITFALLEYENELLLGDYTPIAYLVQNRKTLLERVQIVAQTFATLKTGFDEVHKIINIASDLPTLGVIPAGINLAVTVANLILLIQRLIQLFKEINESFFPPVLFHSGIKPSVFIRKAVQYMGYDDVNFGTFTDRFEKEALCPSKNSEIGSLIEHCVTSGALKPNDKGYNLYDMVEMYCEKYNLDRAIRDNVLHMRPKNDPFWIQNPNISAPDVLVESALEVDNGTYHKNYEDFYSNTIVQYASDNSDLWSLEDLANENDPNSVEKIIAGVIVKQQSTLNNKRVISQKGKIIDIPHTLASRKDVLDDLIDLFVVNVSIFDQIKGWIEDQFNQFATELGTAYPGLDDFLINAGGRTGAMKVENHYFSVAKCVYLEEVNLGIGTGLRIPENYADYVGARAIYDDFHTYNSLVPGVRNANDTADTNAKLIFENIKIDFNLRKFKKILDNPYFSIGGGKYGKYTDIKWNERHDYAYVNYWIPEPWMQNVEEVNIQPI